MSNITMRVYFEDEAPRIGAGWRTVHATLGPKWARLRCAASGRGVKIRRAVFDRVLLKGEKAPSTSVLMLGPDRQKPLA